MSIVAGHRFDAMVGDPDGHRPDTFRSPGVGLIHDVRPAAEIVRSIVAEAEETLRRLDR